MQKQLIHYRYRIFEDTEHSTISIDNIKLSKAMWHTSPHKLEKLDKWVRSLNNPSGIVEYEEIDRYTNSITYKPPMGPPEKFYTRDELFVMSRDELCEIAGTMCIPTINIKNDSLIRLILNNQTRFQNSQSAV